MNYVKLSLLVFSATISLLPYSLTPPPAHSAPIIAQVQSTESIQLAKKGFQYIEQEKWDLALSSFNQALAIDPNFPYAYLGRAVALINKTDAPTLVIIKDIEKDLQTAASLLSSSDEPEVYKTTVELLEKVSAIRKQMERDS